MEIEPPERQNRWMTGFRLFLAIPAFLVAARARDGAAFVAAMLSWFYALARGRVPRGCGTWARSSFATTAQTFGYVYLLTDRYPYSGPAGWRWS